MIIIIIILILTALIVYPFWIAIVSSCIIAYIFYPIYIKIKTYLNEKKTISSLLTVILIILVILLPLVVIINTFASEAFNVYDQFIVGLSNESQNIAEIQSKIYEKTGIEFNIKELLANFTNKIISATSSFLSGVPEKIIQIAVFIFLLFYMLKEGNNLLDAIKKLLPFDYKIKHKLISKTDELLKALIYGSLITSLIQGFVGGLGFFVLGINSPIFWGILMAFFALIPFIGTPIIWLPTTISLLFQGFVSSSSILIIKGIILFLYGVFVISLVDNFIKPYFISNKGKLHPAIVLLSILGGLSMFGFIGIILGPLIMTLFLSLVELYNLNMNKTK